MEAQSEALQSWWTEVRTSWKLSDLDAGKALLLPDVRILSVLRGLDESLSKLYVRRSFDGLYTEILEDGACQSAAWLCHINGNPGVGKSAFLWYFIIREGIQAAEQKQDLLILYESFDVMWEFNNDSARVVERASVPASTFRDADWHLINQRVSDKPYLGRWVLVAASPDRNNVKSAKADRSKTTVYMYPWEKDEFAGLESIWKERVGSMLSDLNQVEKRLLALDKKHAAPLISRSFKNVDLATAHELLRQLLREADELLGAEVPVPAEAADLACKLLESRTTLQGKVQELVTRLGAAELYYTWFGGIPRYLWSLSVKELTEEEFSGRVRKALSRTDLMDLIQCVQQEAQVDDISWSLLHFKRPAQSTSCQDYHLDFCSSKVRFLFLEALTSMELEKLRLFMRPSVLHGYVFEELAIVRALQGPITMVHMVDDKHCNRCGSRQDRAGGKINWIACDGCDQWYHQVCFRWQVFQRHWYCPSCEGKQAPLTVKGKYVLRYYEGSLEEALMEAGADAVNYVWRPLKKDNGAVDFILLPGVMAQPTIAKQHPVSAEALQAALGALKAWNEKYGGKVKVNEFILCFLLAEENYETFGFQSYRDKSRRVTQQAVRGIRQCKVLVEHDGPLQSESLELPTGMELVDDVGQCRFDGSECVTSYSDEEMFRHEERELNKKRKRFEQGHLVEGSTSKVKSPRVYRAL